MKYVAWIVIMVVLADAAGEGGSRLPTWLYLLAGALWLYLWLEKPNREVGR